MRIRTPVFVALLLVSSLALAKEPAKADAPERKVNVGAFITELMKMQLEGDQTQMVIWMPKVAFAEISAAQAQGDPAVVGKQLSALDPFNVMLIARSVEAADGTKTYATEDEIRATAVIVMPDGTEVAPVTKVPTTVAVMAGGMRAAMAAQGDIGKNIHVIVFSTRTADGKLIVDASKRDKLALLLKAQDPYKQTVCTWRTPFEATSSSAPCDKCKEALSAKWTFCPYCGAKIAEAKP